MIATEQHRHWAGFTFHYQRFNGAIGRDLEEGSHVLNAFHAGSRHLLHRCTRRRTRCGGRNGFRQLDVGGVIGVGAIGDEVFAGIGQYMKLVRGRAPDRTRVRRHGTEFETEPGENPAVSVIHGLVGGGEAVTSCVKGIGVLHQEFACAHHAEARADFVAEFHLDLVEVDRQLAIAFDLAARHIGDDFLVGGAKAEIALMAVTDFQHLRAEYRPAPGFLPQFRRLHRRHQEFDGASAVHFLAHHSFDPAQYFQAQWHPGVESGTQTFDESGAQHEFVADEFGLGRGFLGGGEKEPGDAHDRVG